MLGAPIDGTKEKWEKEQEKVEGLVEVQNDDSWIKEKIFYEKREWNNKKKR